MMIFCPIPLHLCMTMPFIMCSIVKECWSVGYVSLLTFFHLAWFVVRFPHVIKWLQSLLNVYLWCKRFTFLGAHTHHNAMKHSTNIRSAFYRERRDVYKESSALRLYVVYSWKAMHQFLIYIIPSSTDSAVINDLYEPANFKVVIQLLFKVRLLLQEKPACLNKEDISQMHICYNNIITVCKIHHLYQFIQNKTNKNQY